MKTNCPYPECNQRVEYSEEFAGTVVPCPRCNRGIPLSKLSFFQRNPWKFFHNIISSIATIFIDFIKWGTGLYLKFLTLWFDINTTKPSAKSPYYITVGVIYITYLIIVGVLLATIIIGTICCPIYTIKNGNINQTNEFIKICILLGQSLLSCIAIWIGGIISWIVVHIFYKIARVIFDIAEYARFINNKIGVNKLQHKDQL